MNRIETGLQITPLTGDTKALNVKGSSNLNSTYSIWAENLAGYELFKVRDDRTILFGNNLQGSTQIHADINDGGQLKVGSPTLQGKVSIQQSSGWGSYGLAIDMGSPTDTSGTGLYLRTRSTSGATAIGGSFITTAGGGSGSNISRAIYAEATGADFNQAIIVPSNGGNIGFGTSLPDSRLHVVGSDSTSSNYGLKVDNSASSSLLYVRNDGHVGIGTSSPNYTCEIVTPSNSTGLLVGDLTVSIATAVLGTKGYFGTSSNHDLGFLTNGSERVTILSNGNVGINQFTATAKLHIKGIDSTSSNYALKVDNSASSPLLYVKNDGYVNVGLGNITLGVHTAAPSVSAIFMGATPTSSNYVLAYNGGNIYLNGDVLSYSIAGSVKGITNSSYTQFIQPFAIGTLAPSGSNAFVVSGESYLKGISTTSSNYALKVDNSASSPLLYVRNDGNIGIGTTSPTAKLQVAGSFIVDGKINTNTNIISTSGVDTIDWGSCELKYNTSIGLNWSSRLLKDGFNNNTLKWSNEIRIKSYLNPVADLMGDDADLRILGDPTGTAGNGLYFKATNSTLNWRTTLKILNNGSGEPFVNIIGGDSTDSNYALKVDNSASSPLLYVRNDAKVSIGKTTTLTTLDIQGDTTNALLKLNNSNFLFSDKLRIDNVGSFYSGSINAFGGFGTGNFTTDHLNYTFNTSYSTFLSFTNALGAGNKSSYGIIGGNIGSSDSDYKLVVLNNDAGTIGNVLKIVSTASSSVNDGFDYTNYGINIISNGALNNLGAGTFYKVGINVNVSNGEINYAGIFNGGNSGFGISNPTAIVHTKGIDSTSSNYALKVDNSAFTHLLYVKNDGEIEMNGFTIRQLSNYTIFKTSGTNGYLFNNSSDSTNLARLTDSGVLILNQTASLNPNVQLSVQSNSTGNLIKESIAELFKKTTNNTGILVSAKEGVSYIQGVTSANGQKVDLIMGGYDGAGNQLESLFLKNSGVVAMPTLQVGNVGLVSGDLYVDTAANVLANGDKVVAMKV